MDKEKLLRKKALERRSSLPAPPPEPNSQPVSPTPPTTTSPHHHKDQPRDTKEKESSIPDALKYLLGYKDREKNFLRTMEENCVENRPGTSSDMHKSGIENECKNYITPLLNRSGSTVVAALATHDALDQLDKLYSLLHQLLSIHEQNNRMRRNVRDLETLYGLKKMQLKLEKHAENLDEIDDLSDTEALEAEIAQNEKLWDTILAAGRSASNKRMHSKRARSKSIIAEEQDLSHPSKQPLDLKQYPLRRQSAITDFKAKVSKWTKVKAAFKWERANVATFHEGKSTDSGIGLIPVNNEIARYLRVPSVPCAAGSSGDSVLSSSSGHLLSGGSAPPSPGTVSPSSSMEDVFNSSEDPQSNKRKELYQSKDNDSNRRSHSLDGESVLGPPESTQLPNKTRTPWKKVKNLIQPQRGSFKEKPRTRSVKSLGSVGYSRDVSPCDSNDALSYSENFESNSSSQTSPIIKNMTPALTLTAPAVEIGSCPSSPISVAPLSFSSDDVEVKSENEWRKKYSNRGSRKSKILQNIEVLPEGVPLDYKCVTPSTSGGEIGIAMTHKPDLNYYDPYDPSSSPVLHRRESKWSRVKKVLGGPSSVSGPNSPTRHIEFFGDSEDLSSGDFSEPTTPLKKEMYPLTEKDEIEKNYIALQRKLNREFEAKEIEFVKLRSVANPSPTSPEKLVKDEKLAFLPDRKSLPKPLMEDNLSADFKKKLHEWRIKKQQSMSSIKESQSATSCVGTPTQTADNKKIDWQLWKTGQIKLEGQGLIQLPDEKDLPEDFQKKLDEWKRIKGSNVKPNESNIKRQSIKQDGKRNSSGGNDSSHSMTKKFDFELHKIKRAQQRERRDKNDKGKIDDRDKNDKSEKIKLKKVPAKEVTVQTTDGVLKFEGISRKFTRKLYEWEKSKGIGPESSTFALLHPGYRPLAVGYVNRGDPETREKSPGPLSRSFSLDSISPAPSIPSISHQPSSLSLNDADELKDNSTPDRRRCSNPELEIADSDVQEEPEAVIVEVEDEIEETAAPLFTISPRVERHTAVYHYEKSPNEICVPESKSVILKSPEEENVSLKAISRSLTLLEAHQNGVDHKALVLDIQLIVGSLNTIPIHIRRMKSKSYDQIKESCQEIVEELKSRDDGYAVEVKRKLRTLIQKMSTYLKDLTQQLNDQTEEDVPTISITPAHADQYDHHHHHDSPLSVATMSISPEVQKNEVRVHQVQIMHDNKTEPKEQSSTVGTEEKSKKVTRSSSNGKRKVKLRRMGSRQSSKTETESDEDAQNFVLETPRKCKRKTSRAKRALEIEKQPVEIDQPPSPQSDEIVYTMKIRPESIVDSKKENDLDPKSGTAHPDNFDQIPTTSTNVFIKTKRKIFSPWDDSSGVTNAVIVHDLDPSSPTEPNQGNSHNVIENDLQENDEKKVMKLPPLPQSPITQRKIDQQKNQIAKELSPSIRMMIAKYNQRLSAERSNTSPMSSGSCSPVAWRSPVLERRVRAQTQKYQEKVFGITKSSSAGNLEKSSKSLMNIDVSGRGANDMNDKQCDLVRSVKKSLSAGRLETRWEVVDVKQDIGDKKNEKCDEKQEDDTDALERKERKERLYKKHLEKHPKAAQKIGAAKKIATKTQKEDPLQHRRNGSPDPHFQTDVHETISLSKLRSPVESVNKSDNVNPKISRKYENKSNSMKLHCTPSEEIDLPTSSFSAPGSPGDEIETPKTPISDHAKKILKAKEEFLNSSSKESTPVNPVWSNRHSQISVGSESSQECALLKSASVGRLTPSSSDNQHQGGYTSLPRNTKPVTEDTTKHKHRFGLSTIASKLKKVKLRKSSKDLSKMNAVSLLARQSLMVDITGAVNNKLEQEDLMRPQKIESSTSATSLVTPPPSTSTGGFTLRFRNRHEKTEKLKKSRSVGAVDDPDAKH